MHIVFVHFHYLINNHCSRIYKNWSNDNFKLSIIRRSNKNFTEDNNHYINDEFDQELLWWQNPEKLNKYIGNLNPDIVYIFGLNLPLHFRWLRHHLKPNALITAQHCGEDIWIQRNLWLQQSALRIVDGFVFESQADAAPWLKCAAVLESQPIFDINKFKNEINRIHKKLVKNKISTQTK